MRNPRMACTLTSALALGLAAQASAQEAASPQGRLGRALARGPIEAAFRSMNRPFEPFRVIGNVYYVGASGVSSFLVATPEGHVLIDSGFAETVPLIREGVRKLGFRFGDVKLLLGTHAHVDHAGGHARVKAQTGATLVSSRADAELLARGGRGDFLPVGGEVVEYEPARADRVVVHGETVSLGGTTLTAHLTPGHTRGCTTWTTIVAEGGRRFDVVFLGGTTLLPGVRLVGNPAYPQIADDFAATFRRLRSLPCDVFLAPHGFQFGLAEKARRLAAGARPNPFIDPDGYRAFVDAAEGVVLRGLARERGAAKSP
jgi:metallo-beta-lactamase class B